METLVNSLIKILILIFILSSFKVYQNLENLHPKIPQDLRAGEIQSSGLEKLVEGDILRISKKDETLLYMKYQSFRADTLFATKERNANKSIREIES